MWPLNPFYDSMFGDEGVDLGPYACTDSCSSDSGAYAATQNCSGGNIGANGGIIIDGPICGDVAKAVFGLFKPLNVFRDRGGAGRMT